MNEALVVLSALAIPLTGFINAECLHIYYKTRSNYNAVIALTFFFGILSSIAQLFYAISPDEFSSANKLGEVSLAIAASLHETLNVYRFGILSQLRFNISTSAKSIAIGIIWLSGVFRMAVEFVPSTPNLDAVREAASIEFYGLIGLVDVVLAAISLRLIYEIKSGIIEDEKKNEEAIKKKGGKLGNSFASQIVKTLTLDRVGRVVNRPTTENNTNSVKINMPESRGLKLIRKVQEVIFLEIVACLLGLVFYVAIEDKEVASLLTDLCIYSAGFFAIRYSKKIMKIIALKPNARALSAVTTQT